MRIVASFAFRAEAAGVMFYIHIDDMAQNGHLESSLCTSFRRTIISKSTWDDAVNRVCSSNESIDFLDEAVLQTLSMAARSISVRGNGDLVEDARSRLKSRLYSYSKTYTQMLIENRIEDYLGELSVNDTTNSISHRRRILLGLVQFEVATSGLFIMEQDVWLVANKVIEEFPWNVFNDLWAEYITSHSLESGSSEAFIRQIRSVNLRHQIRSFLSFSGKL